jgi:ribose 1,5-bisphosphokinase
VCSSDLKDSLINFARTAFAGDPSIGFVRRVITRAQAGGGEEHDCVSDSEFDALRDDGRFAVWWPAHGLKYGIPVETRADLARGRTLICNGSRKALEGFRAAYPKLSIIEVTAAPSVLAARLAARGRETEDEIRERIGRQAEDWQNGYDVVQIDNSGALEEAGRNFVASVNALSHRKITILT